MKNLKNLLRKLDGNKTVIGLFLMQLANELAGTVDSDVFTASMRALYYIGMAMAGTGAGHKLLKMSNAGQNKP